MKLIKFHLKIARLLDTSDRPVYLFSVFSLYLPLVFMVLVIILKVLDSANLISAPLVYAAPTLSWEIFETVSGWAYVALLVIGLNLHFKGLANLPESQKSASIRRYIYYYQHGWTILKNIWHHFKRYSEIRTLLIYLALFIAMVYLYNTL